MGTTCIVGVDQNNVLKDFVRAHVELLRGNKVCLEHWYPDLTHDGWTIRQSYSTSPLRRKLVKLMPHAAYDRLVTRHDLEWNRLHDAFAGFFRRHDVDVILAEFGTTGADIAPHAKALGIPLVVHFHGHDAHRASIVSAYRERYAAMFGYAFGILSVSRYMTETLVAMGARRDSITYNPYGPREKFFGITPAYGQVILSLGRFTDIKANYLTLAAFARASREVPGARLVMAGDGELLETCRTLASVWGIGDRVSFPGAVAHVKSEQLFAEACCFAQHSVSPSYGDAEGTPVAILEAGAAGLPVIATRHAGIPDVVLHDETGFLVEERDVEGQAEYMIRLLRDPALCRVMGEKARLRVREQFSLESHIGRLQGLIDSARQQQARALARA